MFYVKNVPVWERVLRIAAAAGLLLYALLAAQGTLAWIAAAAGAGLLLSGLFGFCPACALLGRRLDKR